MREKDDAQRLMILCAGGVSRATLLMSTQFMSAQNGKGKRRQGKMIKDQPPPVLTIRTRPGILPADLDSEDSPGHT